MSAPTAVFEIHFPAHAEELAAAHARNILWLTLGSAFLVLWALLYRLMSSNSRRLRTANRALQERGARLSTQAAELEHLAFHDTLTGLPNRALFQDRLEVALAQRGRSVAVLLVDLDDFETVNDSLGHAAGDELLVKAAEALSRCVRQGDTVARFGGDEFSILLQQGNADGYSARISSRVLESLCNTFSVQGTDVVVGASVGIAGADAQETAGELLRNADLALYAAKSRGKRRFARFEPAMHEASFEHLTLAAELRHALEREEIFLEYQPIFAAEDQCVVGAEALVRWQHPTRGRVAPAEFIPLAEQTGWIVDIGAWVLREAVAQAAAWQGAPPDGQQFGISVNLSGRQLRDPRFALVVREALQRSNLRSGSLTLEITESLLMDHADTADALSALVAEGVRLSIDDFGTGYSSLARLASFPVDEMKIDRSFLNASPAGKGADVVPAIVFMAHRLGLTVVGEGVERSEQLDRLRHCQCDSVQGFLLGRPTRSSDFEQMFLMGTLSTRGLD
jgi:diguanylate cyclase (GGDEF)-like protein